jgi:rRNA pseudouridine-1189 N-methylase Emg1 (Nep1/Mra1 family)
MGDQFKGKRVPWPQLEEYLSAHKKLIATFVELKQSELMEVPDIENKLPKSFFQLHQVITKILKDNTILPDVEESKVNKVDQHQL